jgi:hypothetical protein
MDYLEKLIPLAVLAAVAAFLLVVLRRAAREQVDAPPAKESPILFEQAAMKTPEPAVVHEKQEVLIPTVMKREDETIAVTTPVIAENTRPKKKKRTLPAVVTVIPAATPIETVLDLLKEKDTLAAALVLHEILGQPVSKRR